MTRADALMAEYRGLCKDRTALETEIRTEWRTMSLQRAQELERKLLKGRDRIEALEQTKSVGDLIGTRRD